MVLLSPAPDGPVIVHHDALAMEDVARLYRLVRGLFDHLIFSPALAPEARWNLVSARGP